jgi:predicted outer membrane protein
MKALVAATFAAAALLALGGAAGAAPRPPVDTWWLQSSIQGDRFEIAVGSWAESRAQTPEAKALAAQLVGDHTQSLRDATALARRINVAVPSGVSGLQAWLLLNLKSTPQGTAFDQALTSLEVQDHMLDISDTKLEIEAGAVPAAVEQARHELRTLRVHLMLAQKAWHATI